MYWKTIATCWSLSCAIVVAVALTLPETYSDPMLTAFTLVAMLVMAAIFVVPLWLIANRYKAIGRREWLKKWAQVVLGIMTVSVLAVLTSIGKYPLGEIVFELVFFALLSLAVIGFGRNRPVEYIEVKHA